MRIAAFLMAALAIGLVGNMDYQDEQDQEAYQCNMIEAGHWPAEVNHNCEMEVADAHE